MADEADADRRWSLLLEFLEEYEHEPATNRRSLVEAEPARTGDVRWDALLAGIAEWLAARDSVPAPTWVVGGESLSDRSRAVLADLDDALHQS